ncbi:MAG TPA: hypothetical protein VKJ45_08655 [Blastocatellia bacterium]|nr:hypothetical protein [Blastocatellia bacterium]
MPRDLKYACIVIACLVLACGADQARAAEQDALAISANIQQRHMPNGTVIDPVFASATSQNIVAYTRGGDSAIWTGHYLAAEAFRYKVTGSPDALANVWSALRGIRSLRVVTGNNLLARCLVPVNWQFASAITNEEASHGIFNGTVDGQQFKWVGGTSRDQYSGVFFGLGVAYDVVDDATVRAFISNEVTGLLSYLIDHDWAVIMPDFSISTVFLGRADQQLSFLAVGRRVNPEQFDSAYTNFRSEFSLEVLVPIAIESLDDYGSYFKFNLDEINLYNLIRLEDIKRNRKRYMKAYRILRSTIANHGNAHFNVIDRALTGPDSTRDAEIVSELDDWLTRPRRDVFVDNRGKFPACGGNRACDPLPVAVRVPTDFLWQRNPFDLSGGGAGTIESAGIDYVLPYWMARFYGVL